MATTAAQSFQGHLKIENIAFPEGNQLAHANDMVQDSTGLLWFQSYRNFYTYDGQYICCIKIGLDVSSQFHVSINQKLSKNNHKYQSYETVLLSIFLFVVIMLIM